MTAPKNEIAAKVISLGLHLVARVDPSLLVRSYLSFRPADCTATFIELYWSRKQSKADFFVKSRSAPAHCVLYLTWANKLFEHRYTVRYGSGLFRKATVGVGRAR